MILDAVLAATVADAGVAAWWAVPRLMQRFAPGSGLHRYAMTPAQLRAESARHARLARDLKCAVVHLVGQVDAVTAKHSNATVLLGKAEQLVADLEEQVREVPQLRQTVTALRAELANTRPIRPLLTDRAEEDTLPHGIQVVTGAAFATTDPGRVRA